VRAGQIGLTLTQFFERTQEFFVLLARLVDGTVLSRVLEFVGEATEVPRRRRRRRQRLAKSDRRPGHSRRFDVKIIHQAAHALDPHAFGACRGEVALEHGGDILDAGP